VSDQDLPVSPFEMRQVRTAQLLELTSVAELEAGTSVAAAQIAGDSSPSAGGRNCCSAQLRRATTNCLLFSSQRA
jgi:hypothetical protein